MTDETDHITTSKMERFCERALDQAELKSVARHVSSCVDCSAELVDVLKHQKGTATLSFTLASDFWLRNEHLDYDQLLEVTNNKVDASDREQIELHLKSCRPCEEDVRSFLAFQNQIAPEMSVSYFPRSFELPRDQSFHRGSFTSFAWKPIYAATIVLIGIVVVLALFLKWRSDDFQARNPAIPNVNQGSQSLTPGDNRAANNPPAPNESPTETPSIALTLNDGARTITIDKAGNIAGVDDLPASTRDEIAKVLSSESIARPGILKELKGEDSSLRGSNTKQSFKLISPARVVLVSNRPIFKWERVTGASSYRVYVSGPGAIEVARSEELSSERSEWIPSKALRRGEIYTWSVVAVVDGKEIVAPGASAADIKFKVLSNQSVQQLNQLQKSKSHLALGVFYASEGLIAEAQREFQILQRDNKSSQTARKLLDKIQGWQKE